MEATAANPTESVNLDFNQYLAGRQAKISERLVSGIPDYAFSLDLKLRQKLAAISPIRYFAQALNSMHVPIMRQQMQMKGVMVGPKQYPEVYAITEDCARTLGIGVPTVFVHFDPIPNAYTLASSEASDIIVIHSALVEALSSQELKFVIGHECGHIHNLHSVYNTAAVVLAEQALMQALRFIPGLGLLAGAIQKGALLFLRHWSRCAEITCDRAGLICCGDILAGQTALAKLTTGGGKELADINIDQYLKQIKEAQNSPLRLMELEHSHPLIPKRIEAIRIFADCDVLHNWRPELRSTNSPRTRDDVDAQIAAFINVFAKGRERDAVLDKETK